MKVIREDIDSIVFERNVLKLDEIDFKINFSGFEKDYCDKYNPYYVYTKLPISKIDDIHYLEQHGFEFIECQMRLFKRLTDLYDVSAFENELKVEEVKSKEDLQTIFDVSDRAFNDIDRIYIDNKIDNKIAQKRYHHYIKNSFEKDNQRLDKLIDLKTGKIIGFHTLLYKNEKDILLFLGGILPEYQKTGANYALDYAVYNSLYNSGHKNITTHISAGNIKVMNYLIKVLGFKSMETFVVMRKVY